VGVWLARSRGAALLAAGLLLAGLLVLAACIRRKRIWRTPLLEALSLGALAAVAAPIALVGDARWRDTLAVALVLVVHASLSVPIVRTELRHREHGRRDTADLIVLLGVAGGVLALVLLGAGALGAALLPRAASIALRRVAPAASPLALGLRETALLASAATLALVARGMFLA
jgi:hypothetical protein